RRRAGHAHRRRRASAGAAGRRGRGRAPHRRGRRGRGPRGPGPRLPRPDDLPVRRTRAGRRPADLPGHTYPEPRRGLPRPDRTGPAMNHPRTDTNRFAPGTFSRPSAPASVRRMTGAQTRMELSLFLRNGEQRLVALIIPLPARVALVAIDFGAVPEPRGDHAITAVLTMSVMGTSFTGQAIAVAFDRRYDALKRLGGTPLPPAVIIAGKI